jgi:hypothetical protein
LLTFHLIYISHQVVLEVIRTVVARNNAADLLDEIDVTQRIQENRFKFKAVSCTHSNINEVLYVLSHPELRAFWQTGVVNVAFDDLEKISISYRFSGKKFKEEFTTTLYREGDNVFAIGKRKNFLLSKITPILQ